MRALDLFCGAGGATRGLQLAGFHVTGVDKRPQPNYVGDEFIQEDALYTELDGYDFIWASPPCQRHSLFARNLGVSRQYPDLVGRVRKRLRQTLSYWVIENVPGAPLRADVTLCGTMFGLQLQRHRLFELNWPATLRLDCSHTGDEIPVYGKGTPYYYSTKRGRNVRLQEKKDAMGIHWMSERELVEAVPPAYAAWLGRAAARLMR